MACSCAVFVATAGISAHWPCLITLTRSRAASPPAWQRRRPVLMTLSTRGARPTALALALVLAATALPLPAAWAQSYKPGPFLVSDGGSQYSVTTLACPNLTACAEQIRATAVWGNHDLAVSLATAVDGTLGYRIQEMMAMGPFFVYGLTIDGSDNSTLRYRFFFQEVLNKQLLDRYDYIDSSHPWTIALVAKTTQPSPSPAPPAPAPSGAPPGVPSPFSGSSPSAAPSASPSSAQSPAPAGVSSPGASPSAEPGASPSLVPDPIASPSPRPVVAQARLGDS